MKLHTNTEKYAVKNGSILLTVLIVMFVLSMTLGSLLTLSTQYFYSTQDKIDSEQAFYLAEAGIEAACSYVTDQGTMLPPTHNDGGTIGNGTFSYELEREGFDTCNIVAIGEINGKRRAVTLLGVRSSTYAKFAFFTEVNGKIYFSWNEVFFGHIHTGDEPYFSGNPIFNDIFTTAASKFGQSSNDAEFKAGYKMDTDLGSMADVDFSRIKDFASTYDETEALLLTAKTEIEFDGDQMLITNAEKGWDKKSITMNAEQLIYIQDGTGASAEPTYEYVGKRKGDYNWASRGRYYYYAGKNKGYYDIITGGGEQAGTLTMNGGIIDGRVTIVTEGDISINDHIEYAINPTDEDAVAEAKETAKALAEANGEEYNEDDVVNDALGIISGGNVIIPTSAPNNINIHASIMATGTQSDGSDGSFYVDNHNTGSERGYINLVGGIVQRIRGAVGLTDGTAYRKRYTFDTRFAGRPPPYFPPLQSGLTFESWQETTSDL